MTTEDERELRAQREHRELKQLRQRVLFLERELSNVGELLHEALVKRYFNEHRCPASYLARVQELYPPIEGERR
jgi:hypothetical protein